ncbi:FixH family protein [Rhizobium sp. CSW-27]|uniref:FixH family protein n=1 Tax=Rhizobium sp. CSW-27 TaxID=2839985 RepID=UPI001C019A2D|nr:FixH family protein [Rhizobium sp. CSW-27]MBT9371602.1 FixH family protein [Rhizobium sp. CSW-27]
MNTRQAKEFVFTGWHMLGVICLFFGTIISVNFYMAYQAVHSWSGLVVENTYVASQQFNGKVAEAKALNASGISGTLTATDGLIRYVIVDEAGQPVFADKVTASFKRPVGDHQDFEVMLNDAGKGSYEAVHAVAPGHWIADVSAFRDGRRILHHARRIAVLGEVQ